MFLSVGGYVAFLGILPLSKHYEPWSGTFLTILNCAFDSSTIVFIVYLKIYQATKLSPHIFFAILIVVPIITIFGTIFWPRDPVQGSHQDSVENKEEKEKVEDQPKMESSEVISLENQEEKSIPAESLTEPEPIPTKDVNSNEQATAHPPPIKWTKEMLAPLFLLFIYAWAVHELFINVYVGSVETRMMKLAATKEEAVYYIEIFGWILPGAIIVSPVIGFTIDKMGVIWTFVVIQICSMVFTALLFVPILWVQILTFLSFALYRGYFFSWCFVFLLQKFQLKNFGRLFGISALVCGSFAALQYLIYYIVIVQLEGQYFWANIVQVIGLLSTNVFLAYLLYDRYRSSSKSRDLVLEISVPSINQKEAIQEFSQLDDTHVYISPSNSPRESIQK